MSEMRNCIKCGDAFSPTAYQLKKGHFVCSPCHSAYMKAYHAKRRAEGHIPKQSAISQDREYHRKYAKEYNKRPEVRERRRRQTEERMKNPAERMKAAVRLATRQAIRRGEILKMPCEVCGAEKAQAHHEDYDKPLDVVWLCPVHHRARHDEINAKLKAQP